MDLDPRYRFENYIVGGANRLAVSAARAVAQSPGTSYNPLFIYSSSGLGKTHLMLAIGHLARQLQPRAHGGVRHARGVRRGAQPRDRRQRDGAVQASASTWWTCCCSTTCSFWPAARRRRARCCGSSTRCSARGSRSCSRAIVRPSEIADLDERLITRLTGGLVVDVGTPDYETRVAILRSKCDERGVVFEAGVLDEVARINFTNVRELQGALNRLIACQTLDEAPVTARSVRELLGEKPDTPLLVPLAGARAGVRELSLGSERGRRAAHRQLARARGRGDDVLAPARLRHAACSSARSRRREEPDVDTLLSRYEASIRRLRELEAEASKIDAHLAASELFRDPERVGEAELVLARLVGRRRAAARARSGAHARRARGGRVEPARGARGRHDHRRAGKEVQPALRLRAAWRGQDASAARARQRADRAERRRVHGGGGERRRSSSTS